MDFGLLGLGGFAGSDASTTTVGTTGFASLASSDPETKQKLYGSGILKQERPAAIDDIWRSSKLSKTESMLQFQRRNSPLKYNTTGLFNDGQHMLSFSSCPKSEAFKVEKGSANATLPYGFHLTSSAYSSRNNTAGISFNGASMHGVLTDARGLFTPSQWMELEHQALIYKYITANVPVPTHLLIPIRKAVDSAGFSIFPSGGLLRPNTLGWGTFHLGFSSSADPEPGRCRRTDGKKWRCSRDAVPDQKYCDRHINRGRHRSRKPVEGQSGHSAAKTATNTKAKASVPAASSSSTSASVVGSRGGSGASTCLAIAQNQHQQQQQQQQLKNLHSAASSDLSRNFLNKENAGNNLFQESSQTDFGLVTPDSLLNPSQKGLSLTGCRSFDGSSHDLTAKETVSQHSIRQFMDDWPKNQSNRSAVSWPELDVQSARTQLSISIPMAPSDFMSSTSSPNREKSTLSPLRLSREHDPVPMGLGVGSVVAEQSQRQANWIPISWETSMGGPLGEVLKKTNNSASECKNASALNLMTEGWDCSPRLGSSPTGVLQKTTFYSVSNSSAGSSPRAENKTSTTEGASLCNDLFGSTLLQSSSSFPSL